MPSWESNIKIIAYVLIPIFNIMTRYYSITITKALWFTVFSSFQWYSMDRGLTKTWEQWPESCPCQTNLCTCAFECTWYRKVSVMNKSISNFGFGIKHIFVGPSAFSLADRSLMHLIIMIKLISSHHLLNDVDIYRQNVYVNAFKSSSAYKYSRLSSRFGKKWYPTETLKTICKTPIAFVVQWNMLFEIHLVSTGPKVCKKD